MRQAHTCAQHSDAQEIARLKALLDRHMASAASLPVNNVTDMSGLGQTFAAVVAARAAPVTPEQHFTSWLGKRIPGRTTPPPKETLPGV